MNDVRRGRVSKLHGRHSAEGEFGEGQGVAHFERAIALAANCAEPDDALSYIYQLISDWTAPPKEMMPKAEAAAKKAFELDDTLAQAHADLASAHFWHEFNFPEAESEFKRAGTCGNLCLAKTS